MKKKVVKSRRKKYRPRKKETEFIIDKVSSNITKESIENLKKWELRKDWRGRLAKT